jgi:hypothetical protein
VGEPWKASEARLVVLKHRLGELVRCDLFVDHDFKTEGVEPELLYGTVRKIMLSTRTGLRMTQ